MTQLDGEIYTMFMDQKTQHSEYIYNMYSILTHMYGI